jgi:hypothetical protein
MPEFEIVCKNKAKLTPGQLSEGTTVLNHMVAEVNAAETTKKTAILNAAWDLERIGFPVGGICRRITMRAAEMNVSEPYVRECLPDKYKNQILRKIRLHRNIESSKNLLREEDPHVHKTIAINEKQDIELINEGSTSSPDPRKPDKTTKNAVVDDKLTESNLVAKLRKEIKDLKWELSFRQEVIDALTKRDREYKRDFANKYESKFTAFRGINRHLEEKNDSYHYILIGLAGISEPGISDEMRLDTVNNFIRRHHDRIAAQVEEYKEERAQIEAQNLKSWQ